MTLKEFWNSISFFGQWYKFWDWIKVAHSSSDEASSKRLYGGILILSCIITFILFAQGVFPIENWQAIYSGWYSLLFIGFGLISVSTVEKLAGVIANFKIQRLFGDKELPESK